MEQYRTDMAFEIQEEQGLTEESGVKEEIRISDGIKIQNIKILTDSAAEQFSKEKGTYVTISFDRNFFDDEELSKISKEAEKEISELFDFDNSSVFVACLGNPKLTADAIGPKAAEKIIVTRHLKDYAKKIFHTASLGTVSLLCPNVLGKTGIETFNIIKSVTQDIKPDIIIIIDALASRSEKRLCSTIQISNTGISPGSGVGNHRNELSKKTLGIPVISIGIPTVIEMPSNEDEKLIVTPKDIDLLTDKCATLIASVINNTLHKNLSEKEKNMFLNF